MIIKLTKYNDLGKFCWPMMKETWNTDKDKVYLMDKNWKSQEIPIFTLEDLVPFLWRQPFCETGGRDKPTTLTYFDRNPEPWWTLYPTSDNYKWYKERRDEVLKELREENK